MIRRTAQYATTKVQASLGMLDRQTVLLDDFRDGDEWLLIVLDACRYDYLARMFDEWFEGHIQPCWSAGRDTFEYAGACWPGQHDVTYVSGATPINSQAVEYELDGFNELYGGYVPNEHIGDIVDVWQSDWDESIGTCPPEAITRRALARDDRDRVVAHYFQPHAPYIGQFELLGYTDGPDGRPFEGRPVDEVLWERVKSGEISDGELRIAYRSNLRHALRSVARLVAQTDHDRVAIVGDHGEALGEYGTYAHPRLRHAALRVVPFARVTGLTEYARDKAGDCTEPSRDGEGSVSERLHQLGYLDDATASRAPDRGGVTQTND